MCTWLYGQVSEKKYNGVCVRESKRERGMEEEREREGEGEGGRCSIHLRVNHQY